MPHSFWVGNLRLELHGQVSSGKQHTNVHTKAAGVLRWRWLTDSCKRPDALKSPAAAGRFERANLHSICNTIDP
jgi:hypothetical protein